MVYNEICCELNQRFTHYCRFGEEDHVIRGPEYLRRLLVGLALEFITNHYLRNHQRSVRMAIASAMRLYM
jgi:hypothetical protein